MPLSFTVTDFVRLLGVQDDNDDWQRPRTQEEHERLTAMSEELDDLEAAQEVDSRSSVIVFMVSLSATLALNET